MKRIYRRFKSDYMEYLELMHHNVGSVKNFSAIQFKSRLEKRNNSYLYGRKSYYNNTLIDTE